MAGQLPVTQQKQSKRSVLGSGKGLLDWIKLCRRFKQQNSEGEQIIVTFEELQRHNTESDCWTGFRGCMLRTFTDSYLCINLIIQKHARRYT